MSTHPLDFSLITGRDPRYDLAPEDNGAPIIGRFDYGPTITGFEVVDRDTGRPVGFEYATAQEANGKAFQLNGIAQSGDRRALARALRAA
jgi:hypothetical protein